MITHAVTSALRGRSLRLLSLITFFFLFLCHATYSQASLLKERDLDFVVNETMLGRGYTQISSLATLPENLRSASASFSEMDFAKVANEPNSMLLIVKFAFFVNKRVDFYSKENIFSKLEFEKISHNTTVLRENRLSANKIVFDIKKKVSLFSIKSKMDVEHYDKEELEGSPYKTIATRVPNEASHTYVFTFQKTYNYSKYFRSASNACIYSESITSDGTIIQCFTISAMEKKSYKKLGIFTNLLSTMEQEILYSVGKIKQQ